MRIHSYHILVVILSLTCIIGCGGGGGSNPAFVSTDISSGKFVLKSLDSIRTPRSSVMANSQIFDLGDLKASRDFYFLLSNGGDKDISNITITSSNASFTVSPSSISSLSGISSSGIAPVIRITAIHGLFLDGVGGTKTMASGENSSLITFSGSTTDNQGNSITTELQANISVNAQVASFTATGDSGLINLKGAWAFERVGMPMNGGSVRYYDCKNGKIKNTGSVPLVLTFLDDPAGSFITLNSTTLAPAGETNIVFANGRNSVVVKVDPSGTITENYDFVPASDGCIYFGINVP